MNMFSELPTRQDISVLLPIIRKYAPIYSFAITLIILSSLIAALIPLLFGALIDQMTQKNWDSLVTLLAVMIILQILSVILRNYSERTSSTKSEDISHDLRMKLMKTIFHENSNHSAFNNHSRGKILSLFNRDIEGLWDFTGFALTELVASVVLILSLSLIVFYLSLSIGILFLLMAFIFTLLFLDNGRRIRGFFARAAPKFDNMIGFFNSLLDGYETLASFRRQKWAQNRIFSLSRNVTDLANHAHRRSTSFSLITGILNILGVLAVWLLILPDLRANSEDSVTIGELVAILFYFNMLIVPLESISGAAKAIEKGSVSMIRLAEFFRSFNLLKPSLSNSIKPPSTGEHPLPKLLVLEKIVDLPAANQNEKSILQPITFSVSKGAIIGLAGSSGSGKSTLLRVIARLRNSGSAQPILEGTPIGDISEDEFRESVVLISQIPVIFPASISENIYLNEEDRDPEAILKMIGLNNRIESPQAISDAESENLSGGECPRLALARMLSRNAKLYLIDEPTSALDHTNSKLVCDAILSHAEQQNASVIVATHNPLVLKMCSEIHLMKDGEIIASGLFGELIDKSEEFRKVISKNDLA